MKRKLISLGAIVLVLALLLTLTPCCGNGDEEATPTPGPGRTPTPGGVTPTPTPETKTLKIGIVVQMSGVAAPWGLVFREGAEWAAAVVNDGGGLQVGGDTYMIETIPCDDKGIGSGATTCFAQVVFDEGVDFIVGPHVSGEAIISQCNENKVVCATLTNVTYSSTPYTFTDNVFAPTWIGGFLKLFQEQFHPEVKTIGIIGPSSAQAENSFYQTSKRLLPEAGLELVAAEQFESGSVDFYPQLTKIIEKNPDVIGTPDAWVSDNALITKQLRELGYTGLIWHMTGGPIADLIAIAGAEAVEGVITNEVNYSSNLIPQGVQEIYQDWQRRFPGKNLVYVHELGYVDMQVLLQAIEEAGSLDSDAVVDVLDDPNWTFNRFGVETQLGGLETFGIARVIPILFYYSEIIDGELVTKAADVFAAP